jgi:hypothetical protein
MMSNFRPTKAAVVSLVLLLWIMEVTDSIRGKGGGYQ